MSSSVFFLLSISKPAKPISSLPACGHSIKDQDLSQMLESQPKAHIYTSDRPPTLIYMLSKSTLIAVLLSVLTLTSALPTPDSEKRTSPDIEPSVVYKRSTPDIEPLVVYKRSTPDIEPLVVYKRNEPDIEPLVVYKRSEPDIEPLVVY
ncbi:hypothetical protein SISSUDRAFT_1131444 [Sistotremastrum suecicum HHB10207 ss-3]|uniref:Uncharacterized protein n=1 Tax=Sistotremastrum suecicum HHB10207 ss-3 TaxID=1314776 RepID=A0A166A607_9AGAM|nr:hypothetical protein SISSUDRAFT_1131444 [Sistotremastrum suecicum HHB10207 ss-3]